MNAPGKCRLLLFEKGRNVGKIARKDVHLYCEKIHEKYLHNSQKCITFALDLEKIGFSNLSPLNLKQNLNYDNIC